MQVFLSWSGERSRVVAELMKEWIPHVIQAVRPWVSSKSINSGEVWFSAIADCLNDCTLGIIFLTQENKSRPWILFEAGALARGANGVCTFLVDLQNSDIEQPLASFNHTLFSKDSVFKLICTINSSLKEKAIEISILQSAFMANWEIFEKGFQKAMEQTANASPVAGRATESVMSEILKNTRDVSEKVQAMERILLRPDPIPGTSDEWEQRMTDGLIALVKQGMRDSDIIGSMGLKGWEGKYIPLLRNIRSFNRIPNPE